MWLWLLIFFEKHFPWHALKCCTLQRRCIVYLFLEKHKITLNLTINILRYGYGFVAPLGQNIIVLQETSQNPQIFLVFLQPLGWNRQQDFMFCNHSDLLIMLMVACLTFSSTWRASVHLWPAARYARINRPSSRSSEKGRPVRRLLEAATDSVQTCRWMHMLLWAGSWFSCLSSCLEINFWFPLWFAVWDHSVLLEQ